MCRDRDGIEADGTVVTEYRPLMDKGKVVAGMKPLYRKQKRCKYCSTPLLELVDGEWRSIHRAK